MKILIVTHTSNDIFIFNFIKWMKTYQPSWDVDVFEFYSNNKQTFDSSQYADVTAVPLSTNKLLRFQLPKLFSPFYVRHYLKKYLKGKHYDIIQCHWIIAPIVISSFMKDYCDRLFVTFWGGELNNTKSKFCRILHSKKLYFYYLTRFLKASDGIINSELWGKSCLNQFPFMKNKLYVGAFGSTPLEELYNLMDKETKSESKRKLGIPEHKITVLIGYSGKQLHQHIPIIQELSKNSGLKDTIHLLAPMTRDASQPYIEEVKCELNNSGYTYTLLSGVFLKDEDVARLRNATEITLQLSEFDGYSRSIIECLCAKSLMIYGSWLDNYTERLENDGFYALPVDSISDAVKKLAYIVNSHGFDIVQLQQNHEMGKGKNLWKICIKDWIAIYSNK